MEGDLFRVGFDCERWLDPQNNELYYKLFIDGEYVGDSELNEFNGDIEIVCYNKVSYDKVVNLVGNQFTIWAWFDNVCTNNN
jgi:hypothetical protein